jgi:prepilin peptidase CpaA
VTSVVQPVAVALLAVLGAGWDLAQRRVPNVLTFGAAAVAVVYFAASDGTPGLTRSLLGWAIGFGLSVPLFAVGALGAGDVKFLAAFGAWLGPEGVLVAALSAAILGGVMALLVAAAHGYLGRALRNVAKILNVWRVTGPRRVEGLTLDDAPGPRLAYAVPIAAGAVVALFWRHL